MSDHPDPDPSAAEEEKVENLLQRAGPRPPIPPEARAAVRSAALEQWQQTVRSERRRRFASRSGGLLAAAALLALAVGLSLRLGDDPKPVQMRLVLEAASGTVWKVGDGERASLRVGEVLVAGEGVATVPLSSSPSDTPGGAPARALFRIAGGPTLRLDTDSRLSLSKEGRLELERGAVYVDTEARLAGLASDHSSDDAAAPACCEIHTPWGSVRDIGTKFEVRLGADDSLRARVRQGRVELLPDAGGTPNQAGAGMELVASRDGRVVQRPLPVEGDPWAWTRQILPRFPAEGVSLHHFLEWAAAEGGWRLHYAEDTTRSASRDVLIHGSLEGLDLEEALEVALLGSGLDLAYELRSETLVIRSDVGGAR
ncbi:MAG: FecR family protein [Holophagales bacterium]|nr:FecR family protein [Holophagales bacterium]